MKYVFYKRLIMYSILIDQIRKLILGRINLSWNGYMVSYHCFCRVLLLPSLGYNAYIKKRESDRIIVDDQPFNGKLAKVNCFKV